MFVCIYRGRGCQHSIYTVVIAVVCVFVKTEERNASLRRSGITTMQMKVDNLNANDKIAMEETNRR